jgi:hypothetical protein
LKPRSERRRRPGAGRDDLLGTAAQGAAAAWRRELPAAVAGSHGARSGETRSTEQGGIEEGMEREPGREGGGGGWVGMRLR